VLWPDDVSLAILRLCDGQRNIASISRTLAVEYEADAEEIEADILAFAQDWSDRMVLRL
jgi:pyrroloquinoline quinone biosynthesis protein D